MSSVMLALFSTARDAESVRTELIRDGIPTASVEVTARAVKTGGARVPFKKPPEQYERYFENLFHQNGDRSFVTKLAQRVATGQVVTLAVHPRNDLEAQRVTEVLEIQGALQVVPPHPSAFGAASA